MCKLCAWILLYLMDYEYHTVSWWAEWLESVCKDVESFKNAFSLDF